jgi:predicted AlkP superfamily phosphohydrolase/phosphomutase
VDTGLSYDEQRDITGHCADLGYIERAPQKLRLLFFGVDGIDVDEVYRLALEEKKLAAFASLMRCSRWGLCLSQRSPNIASNTPHTGPNWLSLMTGQTLYEHGVKSHGWAVGTETWTGHDTCWERLARDGMRVGLMTLPVTYPARDLGGEGCWMVSGFPASMRGCWYWPDEVAGDLPENFRPYDGWTGKARNDEQWGRLWQAPRAKLGPTKRLCMQYRTEILAFGVSFLDHAHHGAWAGWSQRGDAEGFFKHVERSYVVLDELLASLLNWADPDAVVIAGDHGFGLKHHSVNGFYLAWPERVAGNVGRDLHVTDVYGLVMRAAKMSF